MGRDLLDLEWAQFFNSDEEKVCEARVRGKRGKKKWDLELGLIYCGWGCRGWEGGKVRKTSV